MRREKQKTCEENNNISNNREVYALKVVNHWIALGKKLFKESNAGFSKSERIVSGSKFGIKRLMTETNYRS